MPVCEGRGAGGSAPERACTANPSVPLCDATGTRQQKGRGPETPPLLGSAIVEGVEFGLGCHAGHIAVRGLALLVGLPVGTGRGGKGIDRALRGGQERVGLHPEFRREFAGTLGFAFEPVDRLPVFVAIFISQPGGEIFRVRDLVAVKVASGAGGTDE